MISYESHWWQVHVSRQSSSLTTRTWTYISKKRTTTKLQKLSWGEKIFNFFLVWSISHLITGGGAGVYDIHCTQPPGGDSDDLASLFGSSQIAHLSTMKTPFYYVSIWHQLCILRRKWMTVFSSDRFTRLLNNNEARSVSWMCFQRGCLILIRRKTKRRSVVFESMEIFFHLHFFKWFIQLLIVPRCALDDLSDKWPTFPRLYLKPN